MSLFFFSSLDGEICAFTGSRTIILPLNYIPNKLKQLATKNTGSPEEFYAEYTRFLSNEANQYQTIKEEIEHYTILSSCFSSKIFFINHVLLRLSFSSQMKRNKITESSSVLRQIFRYYKLWSMFFTTAYPLIESHFIKESQPGPHYDLHGIIDPFKELAKTLLHDPDFTKKDHSTLAKEIDSMFFKQIQDKYIRHFTPALKSIYFTGGNLLLKHNISNSLRVLTNHPRMIWSYVRSAVKSKKITTEKSTHIKPQFFINHNAIIDPYAFSENKMHVGGQEEIIENQKTWQEILFLWHILRFGAYYHEMTQHSNISCKEIRTLVKKQIIFLKNILNISNQELYYYFYINDEIFKTTTKEHTESINHITKKLFKLYNRERTSYLSMAKEIQSPLCFDFSYRQI